MTKKAINEINTKEILDCIITIKKETDKEVTFKFNKGITKEALLILELLLIDFMDGKTFLIPIEREYRDNIIEVKYEKTDFNNAHKYVVQNL